MFTVGDFARLAQVSKRLLRYYDQIDLFKPQYTDPSTNRRYYSAEQMPTLNRILALKALGLSLQQIRRMLSDQISVDEMEGMLLLKKAEIEQQLRHEINRIRNIESRLQIIRNAESNPAMNVIVKQIPSQNALSVRAEFNSMEDGLQVCDEIMKMLPNLRSSGLLFAILHNDAIDDETDRLDVEMGTFIETNSHLPVLLSDGLCLQFCKIPAVEMMATYIVEGWNDSILTGYSTIAKWVECNGYRLAGSPRELALQLPQLEDGSDGVAEIQFPIESLHTASS